MRRAQCYTSIEVKITLPNHELHKWLVVEEYGTHAPRLHLVGIYDTEEEANTFKLEWQSVKLARAVNDHLHFIVRNIKSTTTV